MTETEPTPESPNYSRDQVIAAFKPFVEQGISNPDDLDLDDPAVAAANQILYSWGQEAQQQASKNPAPEADLELSVSRSTLFVDAGFTDPDYLEEVAGDWLDQDLQTAEESGLTDLADRIRAKIAELNARIASGSQD